MEAANPECFVCEKSENEGHWIPEGEFICCACSGSSTNPKYASDAEIAKSIERISADHLGLMRALTDSTPTEYTKAAARHWMERALTAEASLRRLEPFWRYK